MQEKISSFSSYFSAWAFAGFGAFTLQDYATIIGVLFVVLTYFTNRSVKLKMLDEMRKQGMSKDVCEKLNQ
ncbi:HP1 family phage holin [Vibrio scophthalmi]|uniref:HP1 family phage holin n=1 Tax=Vibrio scophthalmi TaxID=45658 RepID=UPI0022837497|nr:HP1 family phage holin [Vibrio scophthalmi]MCY9802680.1 HP1 family phage holin [Vibrio scophthalmi]